jgi:lysophospholipase L1-like esterase
MPFPAAPRRAALALALALAVVLTAVLSTAWASRAHSATTASAGQRVLVVGDSLAVGLRPYLGTLLQPRRVTWDARSGRTTPEGLVHLRARLREQTPQIVVISLGTNDGPDPARFTSRIDKALRAIPANACIVWADIYRPARKGPYPALNHALRAVAARDSRMVLVHWNNAVLHHKVTLPDGLHPDPAGFRYRSRLIARAIARHCGGDVSGAGDVAPVGGTPAP